MKVNFSNFQTVVWVRLHIRILTFSLICTFAQEQEAGRWRIWYFIWSLDYPLQKIFSIPYSPTIGRLAHYSSSRRVSAYWNVNVVRNPHDLTRLQALYRIVLGRVDLNPKSFLKPEKIWRVMNWNSMIHKLEEFWARHIPNMYLHTRVSRRNSMVSSLVIRYP